MAATTRNQAEAQGLNEHDYVSLDKPQGQIEEALDREGQREKFDELREMFPIFCLTENIPNLYMAALRTHKDPNEVFLEITSADTDPSILLSQCKLNFLDPDAIKPMPFVGWTLEACYEFFTTYLRPTGHFTYFTFLAIDAACVQATAAELIVGSDAADFDEEPEEAPKLKIVRLPIEEVLDDLTALEMLTRTPRETASRAEFGVSVMPPPIFSGGSLDGARAMKRRALLGLPGPEEMMVRMQEKERDEEDEMRE